VCNQCTYREFFQKRATPRSSYRLILAPCSLAVTSGPDVAWYEHRYEPWPNSNVILSRDLTRLTNTMKSYGLIENSPGRTHNRSDRGLGYQLYYVLEQYIIWIGCLKGRLRSNDVVLSSGNTKLLLAT
jgi:hypothetical protein